MSIEKNLWEYINEDEVYKQYKEDKLLDPNDFESFCIGHCKDIEALLIELGDLKIKYDKALELLNEHTMPCEMDDFMNVNSDWCELNCSVDENIFKQCWDKYIEFKLGEE